MFTVTLRLQLGEYTSPAGVVLKWFLEIHIPLYFADVTATWTHQIGIEIYSPHKTAEPCGVFPVLLQKGEPFFAY